MSLKSNFEDYLYLASHADSLFFFFNIFFPSSDLWKTGEWEKEKKITFSNCLPHTSFFYWTFPHLSFATPCMLEREWEEGKAYKRSMWNTVGFRKDQINQGEGGELDLRSVLEDQLEGPLRRGRDLAVPLLSSAIPSWTHFCFNPFLSSETILCAT